MAKRLQVVLQDAEYRDVQRAAHARRISIAGWVRRALAQACRQESSADVSQKLEAIRAASQHSFPTADVEPMLAEVEIGYLGKRL